MNTLVQLPVDHSHETLLSGVVFKLESLIANHAMFDTDTMQQMVCVILILAVRGSER